MRSLIGRSLLPGLLPGVLLAACAPTVADRELRPDSISRAGELTADQGAVVISVRSEMFLDVPLELYFLREGGDLANPADLFVVERRPGSLSLKANTLTHDVEAYRLQPGTYRLVAHGMNCPSVPVVSEDCVAKRRNMGISREYYRPNRNYEADAPSFEVRAGAVTYAGDFVLTARNTVEWSPIPDEELEAVRGRFAQAATGPEPTVPTEYRLRYQTEPRSFEEDAGRRY